MSNVSDMIWIEWRKAIRSKMPLFTAVGSLFMPLGIAFLIFVSRNPQISQKLGLVSAKANLMAYSATDWPSYLGLSGMIIAGLPILNRSSGLSVKRSSGLYGKSPIVSTTNT